MVLFVHGAKMHDLWRPSVNSELEWFSILESPEIFSLWRLYVDSEVKYVARVGQLTSNLQHIHMCVRLNDAGLGEHQ